MDFLSEYQQVDPVEMHLLAVYEIQSPELVFIELLQDDTKVAVFIKFLIFFSSFELGSLNDVVFYYFCHLALPCLFFIEFGQISPSIASES